MITEIISCKITKQTTCYLYQTVLTYSRYITYGKANKILIKKACMLSVKMQRGCANTFKVVHKLLGI